MKIPVPVLIAVALLAPVEDRANTTINAPEMVADWFPDPKHQTACYAQYSPPEFNTDKLDASFSEQVTTIKADAGTLLQHGQSNLSGNVFISQPNRNLSAERLHLFRDENGEIITADVYSNVLLEEPDFRVVGDQAHIAFPTNDLSIYDTQFRNYAQHGRGVAKIITRHDKDPIIMNQVSYTTCPPGDNMWEIRSDSLSLDTDTEQGEAYHSWVYIKGVPVAYSPWISFPLSGKRKSGILKPTFGDSNRSGEEFRIPYYWNIAPNYDATITPLVQSKRGLHLHTEERYLWSKGNGSLLAEIQPHDQEFSKFRQNTLLFNPQELSPGDTRLTRLQNAKDSRMAVDWKHLWSISDRWKFDSEYQWASDDNYFVDLDSDIGAQNLRNLLQQAQLQYSGENLQFRAHVEDYQVLQPYIATLNTPPYRILPELDAQYSAPFLIENLDVELPLNFAHYDSEYDPVTNMRPPIGTRYDVGPALRYTLRYPSGYVIPRVQLRQTEYDLNNLSGLPSQINRTIPISTLDSGLFFERDLNWMGRDFQQTLEPRLFYLYAPFVDQSNIPAFDTGLYTLSFDQLFLDNRFSGHDRIGDANQLTYSALSRWLSAEDGSEKARLSMGQIVYFEDRRVTACNNSPTGPTPNCISTEDPDATEKFSDFITEGVYQLNDHWNLVGDLFWNAHHTMFRQYSARLEWQQSVDRLFNFRYNAIREIGMPDQISTDASFVWRFNPRWRIVSRWNYDWTNQLVIDEFGGIEYENCCWAIRTGARGTLNLNNGHDQRQDTHYLVQWVFKGLTSFGEGFVEQKGLSIPGYRDNFATTY